MQYGFSGIFMCPDIVYHYLKRTFVKSFLGKFISIEIFTSKGKKQAIGCNLSGIGTNSTTLQKKMV